MRIVLFLFILFCGTKCLAYSVLTHEAIIDVLWDKDIQPLLLFKYPGSTEDQLKDARAYAYGGAVAPDIGYYPRGSKLFTDLVHYVRSGDFVTSLLDESKDINDYAFALGVLCHYNADRYGHPIGINRAVPLTYPQTAHFGSEVTYEQDPLAHIRTEFGFDVIQVARGNYVSDKYHKFIGFKVPQQLLERAFYKTYGLRMSDVFKDLPRAINTFRWAVKNLIPVATRAAWASKKKKIRATNPDITRRRFEYRMRNATYYQEFDRKRDKPGAFPSMLSMVIRVVPKVGPLKKYKIKVPGQEAEDLFIRSFDTVLAHYSAALRKKPDSASCYVNIDFDTGNESAPGEYRLADKNYGILILKLKEFEYKTVSKSLKQSILKFYSRTPKGPVNEPDEQQQRVAAAVAELKAFPAQDVPEIVQ
jgi:hypothetical protein